MRRMRHEIRPWVASLLGSLLLLLWAVGPAECLVHLRQQPTPILCDGSHPATPDRPDTHHLGTCPACSPIPPGLLPTPPDLPPLRPLQTLLGSSMPAAQPAPARPRLTLHQPRAPPPFA